MEREAQGGGAVRAVVVKTLCAALLMTSASLGVARDRPLPQARLQTVSQAGRDIPLTLYPAAGRQRGVVIFSHGGGSNPARYTPLVQWLQREGFATVAPTHSDSLAMKAPVPGTSQKALLNRLEDMAVAADVAARRYPALPIIAAGHSYGSVIALARAGALGKIGSKPDPRVRGVLAFSTPQLTGLSAPEDYDTVIVPVMVVSGTKDMGPTDTDARTNLWPVENAGRNARYGVWVDGGTHDAAGDTRQLLPVAPYLRAFLHSITGTEGATRRLDRLRDAPGISFIRKGPAQ